MHKLDSKNAKVGDSVVVKTQEKVTTADGKEIPKGSKLIGHVAKVQPHSKKSQNSELMLQFDQAQLKDGQTVPIRSTIAAVQPPEGEVQSNGTDGFGGGPVGPSGGGSPAAGGASAGARGPSGGTIASAPSPTTANPALTTGGPVTASSQGGLKAGQVVAGSGPNAIRTTDIPNVYLASNAQGSVSGALFSAKSDVRLDEGTRIVLDIAPAANAH